MTKPYAGGTPDEPLEQFCKRFNYSKAENFHGFLTHGRIGVSYHHGQISSRKSPTTYLRCHWKFPLGQRSSDRQYFEHILFHVPSNDQYGAKESFVLVSKKSYENYANVHPIFKENLNLSASPEVWRPQKKYQPFKQRFVQPDYLPSEIAKIDSGTISDDIELVGSPL